MLGNRLDNISASIFEPPTFSNHRHTSHVSSKPITMNLSGIFYVKSEQTDRLNYGSDFREYYIIM